MKIDVLTLFPEMFDALNHSIIGKAKEKGLLKVGVHDIRNYADNKHKRCDDYSYGGGAGMVMMAQPICDAIDAVDPNHDAKRIYMSPCGEKLSQAKVVELSKCENILLLCGHYEGIDERAIELCIDEELSIGDYVLTGGELPAMVVIDSVSRYIENVLGSSESLSFESFSNNLLEYPQYTKPRSFRNLEVPEVLISGNHGEIAKWREEKSLERTKKRRKDLLDKK